MSPRSAWAGWTPRQALGAGGRRPHHHLIRRLAICLAVAALVAAGMAAGGVWWATNHYGDQVTRIPHSFPDGPRPEPTDGTTFLLAGLDSRSTKPTTGDDAQAALWTYGAQRSDTLMLVHLDPDEDLAYTVSIPRDSWVPIPGHGSAKINASFSWGGPALLVQTVEKLTGVRVDHFGIIDWHGFRSLTDEVGGVPITIEEDSYDSAQRLHFKAGAYIMNGEDALAYVRQRHGLPGGDLDRIERQQQFLRSLVGELRGSVSPLNPFEMDRTLGAIARTVSVDDQLSNGDLRDLVISLRHLDSADTHFATAPVIRSDQIDSQSVLILDRTKLREICKKVEAGDLP